MSTAEYRPSIDGLRAVAVISVLLFHWDKRLLPGGFVGVDVFFVISGYLISKIIAVECEAGSFSFSRFYQRRISRIFPVFAVVTFSVLAAASLLYSPQDFASAGAVAVSAAVSATNMKLMRQGDYFRVSPDAQPFLHYWSLAVEEQFYVILPLFMVLAYRWRVSRKKLAAILLTVAVASFVSCLMMTSRRPTWAFYLLPTRAWELLAGCFLGIYPFREVTRTPIQQLGLSVGGLLLIGASLIGIHEGLPFPGIVAAFPVLGATLWIACPESAQVLPQRMLSHPFIVFIGKASYSLYLWHWPVFCFVDYSLYDQSTPLRLSLKFVLTIAMSLVSYRGLESPLRVFLNRPGQQRVTFSLFGLVVAAICVCGLWIRNENYVNSPAQDVRSGGVRFAAQAGRPLVVLMGDSNGSMYGKTLKELSREMDLTVHVISSAAGNPLPKTKLYADSISFIEEAKPAMTVYVLDWVHKISDKPERFATALQEVLQHSEHVILMTQPPILPESVSRDAIRKSGVHPIREDSTVAARREKVNTSLRGLESPRVHVIDIESLFMSPQGEIRLTDSQGRQNYHDKGHLSGHGSDQVKRLLKAKINEILSAPPPK